MATQRQRWTDADLHSLRTVYPHLFEFEMEKVFPGRPIRAVGKRARDLGIYKRERRVFFPREYENEADGWYVTGFTDGEGCFYANAAILPGRGFRCTAAFFLGLRADDEDILQWLVEYFGVGTISSKKSKNSAAPQLVFEIRNVPDLLYAVIPHFDRYPLRAKKRKDYEIWKQVVELCAHNYACRCHHPGHPGHPDTRDAFQVGAFSLVDQLRDGRRYDA